MLGVEALQSQRGSTRAHTIKEYCFAVVMRFVSSNSGNSITMSSSSSSGSAAMEQLKIAVGASRRQVFSGNQNHSRHKASTIAAVIKEKCD